MRLFTIGHSAHSLDKLIRLLDENGVMTLMDVRTTPASRYQPQFNKSNLEQLLPQHFIHKLLQNYPRCSNPARFICELG